MKAIEQDGVRHVVMFSGGVGSWAAAKRVAEKHGTDNLTLLFCDTKSEHPDTYRFLREAAANVGGEFITIADGRDIWEVMKDERFLANSRVDPCSRVLKRELADNWCRANCQPATTIRYVGIDWTESHRLDRLRLRLPDWKVEAPMCEAPYMDRDQVHEWAELEGLSKQYLYRIGQPHANCNGGCVKMGIGGFARLYYADRNLFNWWRDGEQEMRMHLGRNDIAILREQKDKVRRNLPLVELEKRLACGEEVDMFDIGGCGCMVDAA